ncbi:unnamed protein product, partial [Lampetra fluviatilis]
MRGLERELYSVHRVSQQEEESSSQLEGLEERWCAQLQDELRLHKAELQAMSEELDVLIRCLRDFPGAACESSGVSVGEVSVVRRVQVNLARSHVDPHRAGRAAGDSLTAAQRLRAQQ